MVQKSISDLIFDKFSEYLNGDKLLKNVSGNLVSALNKKKISKTEIEYLLKKKENENT